jgi:hypothetical protein
LRPIASPQEVVGGVKNHVGTENVPAEEKPSLGLFSERSAWSELTERLSTGNHFSCAITDHTPPVARINGSDPAIRASLATQRRSGAPRR